MYSGESLFLANDEGNLDQKQMNILYNWTNEFKNERLERVKDRFARNLVSRLLMRDPLKRVDYYQALAHPFISGKRVARLIGEEAEYDVFLSYRVNSDLRHCELLYNLLTERGLKVWWDKKCLQPGVNWEDGFCEGLMKSKSFVALVSKAGMKNDNIHTQNFEFLTESSQCDNILLEYRLALELRAFDFLEAVFPVMIGVGYVDDADPKSCIYAHYFKSNSLPNCPDIVVRSVEEKLCQYLNSHGLGAPIISNRTVKHIFDALLKHQGGFIRGTGEAAFSSVVTSIYHMVNPARNLLPIPGRDNTTEKKTVTVEQIRYWDYCQKGFEILWSGITQINALTSDSAECNELSTRPQSYSHVRVYIL